MCVNNLNLGTMNRLLTFLRSIVDNSNSNSSKSFALLISTLTGGLIALCVCFILIFDAVTNGFIKTDLADLGIFLLCVGMYIAGSGITKAISGRFDKFGPSSRDNSDDYEDEQLYNNRDDDLRGKKK